MRAFLGAAIVALLIGLHPSAEAEEAAAAKIQDDWLSFEEIGKEATFAVQSVQMDDWAEATLWVKCMDDTTYVIVDWKRFIGAGDEDRRITVVYAYDDEKEVRSSETWRAVTNLQGAGIQGRQAIAMARGIAQAKILQLVTGNPAGGTIAAVFKVEGFDRHLPKVQAACHWQ